MLFADNTTMTAVFLGVMAITISFLLMRTSRYFSRQRETPSPLAQAARGRFEARGEPTSAPPELGQWDVRMHETARELSGQLDSKMSALQALIAEADRASARLESALRSAAATSPAGPAGHQAAALQAVDERPLDAPTDKAPGTLADRRKEEIYTLADYGYAPLEIAERSGVPLGEVELILSLRRSR